MSEKVLLGFEVGTGEPVYLPLHHLAVFGMTQLSGKTTTLEALISRSGWRAIAFITKRGESGFTRYNPIPPYYKPRCLAGDTIVIANPFPSEIATLTSTEGILSIHGTFEPCSYKGAREYEGYVVSLKAVGIPPTIMSEDHKVLVAHRRKRSWKEWKIGEGWYEIGDLEWVQAKDCKVGDYVVVPRLPDNGVQEIQLKKYHRRTEWNTTCSIPLSEGIAWLIGLYVADGYSQHNREIHISLNKHEIDKAKKAEVIIARELKRKVRVTHHDNTIELVFSFQALAEWLNQNVGKHAAAKYVPSIMYGASNNIALAFLKGWLDGDGCYLTNSNNRDRAVGITISKSLAYGLFMLFAKVGIPCYLSQASKPQKGLGKRWQLEVSGDYANLLGVPRRERQKTRKTVKVSDNFVFYPIRKLEKRFFKGKLYDATTLSHSLCVPFVVHNSDWQFVEGLVNVALGEKVKYEPGMRWAIMKVCQGRRSLREVYSAAQEMARESKREFMKSVFEKLCAYLEIVLPELERWKFSDRLELSEGVNVMDLSEMRAETQHLVIASAIEYAFQHLDHVIVVIPEAWETMPQGKMTPVKWVAQQFIRKGAAVGNYLFLDSQDIGGVDKTPLRQCDNWLMGRMKEAHEVERILKQLLGMKVSAEEIQTLPLGHFYAVVGSEVKKVYVLPAGVPEEVGREVALGRRTPESVRDEFIKKPLIEDDPVWREKYLELEREHARLKEEFERLKGQLEEEKQKAYREAMQKVEEVKGMWNVEEYQRTIAQLKDEKAALEAELKPLKALKEALIKAFGAPYGEGGPAKVDVEHVGLVVSVHHAGDKVVKVSTDSVVGQILYCATQYFRDREFTAGEVNEKLLEHGWNVKSSTLSAKLSLLVSEGKLVKTDKGYRLPKAVKFEVT